MLVGWSRRLVRGGGLGGGCGAGALGSLGRRRRGLGRFAGREWTAAWSRREFGGPRGVRRRFLWKGTGGC